MLAGHAHGGQWRIPGILNGLWAPNQGLFPAYAGGRYAQGGTVMIVMVVKDLLMIIGGTYVVKHGVIPPHSSEPSKYEVTQAVAMPQSPPALTKQSWGAFAGRVTERRAEERQLSIR